MRRRSNVIAVALLAFTTLASCQDKSVETADVPTTTRSTPSQIPPAQLTATPVASSQRKGKVVDVINTAGYTYVQVDSGDEKVWAAAPVFKVNVNDEVVMPQGMAMKNYHSKTLNRTFDVVYFVSSITVAGADQAGTQLPAGHPGVGSATTGTPPPILRPGTQQASGQLPSGHPRIGSHATGTATPAGIELSGITKPEGGKTVAELYAEKAELSGKQVSVRGKVVKFNAGIMGKNWIHLKDGTGAEGADDLTVTTSATAKLGDTVLVRGMVVTDKDYGYGYTYPLLVENAEVTVE